MSGQISTLITSVLALLVSAGCNAATPVSPANTPPTPANEVIFYNWEGDVPQPVLAAFTREYGVNVTYVIYESQEEAIENMRAGQTYDLVIMESRFVPLLIQEGLLARINRRNIPNFKNISANFRDLSYDPGNQYSVPYSWGTTGLVVRSDLAAQPVTSWADLWDPRYAGKVGLWRGQPRETIALTLKSLGYSANSETPAELETALQRLIQLKPNLIFLEEFDLETSAGVMLSGQAVISMGYANDVLQGRAENPAITYVLPAEGALVWGDNFVIPANRPHPDTAELFLNFLLRPEISAQIVNQTHYASANQAAQQFVETEIQADPVIFPPDRDLKNAEIILPLSAEGQELYNNIWARFLAAPSP
ncbi:MAG: Spermidine/putrescine-binding periplasmic protein [Anaerolineae bacterium]|nr:Spermidine/putrescine-binding periplasmic protein [Anaerolineae bacterium]